MENLRQFQHNINRCRILENSTTELKRCLTTFDLTMVGLNYIIGIGIFILIGYVAKTVAGPAVIVSIIIAASCALLSALCYAEFGCRIPRAGSAYMYTYVTIGEMWAFIIGWNMMLEYVVGAAVTSRGLAGTLDKTFDNAIYNFTVEYVLGGTELNLPYLSKYPDFLAGFLVLLSTVVLLFGVDFSSKINNMLIFCVLLILSTLLVYSLEFADISNLTENGGFFPYGFNGVLVGAGQMFFLFAGFEVICISSEECITPVKSIPIALISTIVSTAFLALLVALCLTLMVSWADIDEMSPFPEAFRRFGKTVPAYIVAVGIGVAISGTILNALHASSRLAYSMAHDGLLFSALARISQNNVPGTSIIVLGSITFFFAVFLSFEALIEMMNIGTIVSYTIVAASLIVLRYRPHHENIFYKVNDLPINTQTCQNEQKILEVGGTLKQQFKQFKLIESDTPGRVVKFALVVFIICSGFPVFLWFNANDYIISGSWSSILLISMFLLGFLLGFGLILLHHQNSEEPPFKVPFVPLIPALSITCNMFLLANLQTFTWIRFVVWVAIGLIIYFAYGYRNSIEASHKDTNVTDVTHLLLSKESEEHNDFGTIEMVSLKS